MSLALRNRLFEEINSWELVDPHTHINPHSPAAGNLAEILGYHYYTELAHSAGLAKQQIEEPNLDPREKVRRLLRALPAIENTIQYSWFVELCQVFFGHSGATVSEKDVDSLYDASLGKMKQADWSAQVLQKSRLSSVFLTNDFDDPLDGYCAKTYVPCLRTDDLVFHLAKPAVRARFEKRLSGWPGSAEQLRGKIGILFEHFVSRGAKACAISLPPDFVPEKVDESAADAAFENVSRLGTDATACDQAVLSKFVFWSLAEHCAQFKLPFDLMIGVNRAVYVDGVYQGQDLFDSRVSLLQYKSLFNAFGTVKFPISVLASVTSQELTAYSWIFPNVYPHGHWWYSNTPTFIEHDLAARLEAVPATKIIGYYSDMYKLEFGLPKFAMFKRILAKILAERFIVDRGWTEERAIDLARSVLKENVTRVFYPT